MGFFSSISSGSRKMMISGYQTKIVESVQFMYSRNLLEDFYRQLYRQIRQAYEDTTYQGTKQIIKSSVNNAAIAFSHIQKDVPAYTAILVVSVAIESVIKSRVKKEDGFDDLYENLYYILKQFPHNGEALDVLRGFCAELAYDLR